MFFKRKIIFTISLFILLPSVEAVESHSTNKISVPIYLFELNPLIYKEGSKTIKGAWFDSFEKLAAKSNLTFDYQFGSVPRIEKMLSTLKPGCNLTFLKTPGRENKMHFIVNHGVKSIIKAYQRTDDSRQWTIEKLQNNRNIKIITNSSVFGDLLSAKKIESELLFNINSIIQMLLMRRIDVYVGSNLAVEELAEFKDGKIKAGLTIKKITHGIACSKGTSQEVTNRLIQASKSWKLEP